MLLFLLARAVTYAAVFIGLVLVFLPSRVLDPSALVQPSTMGGPQMAGMTVVALGAALTVWCILTFVFVGRGTPAPFDPPRRLVIRGPYRIVRNPMYIGAALALAGAALFYRSLGLLAYAAGFLLVAHAFVTWYEEPTLRETFGREYDAYSQQVSRWWPRPPRGPLSGSAR